MTSAAIWAQAKEHIPAILLLGVLIYLAYWIVGMAPWPKRRWSRMAVEWASVEAETLRRFSFSALAIISLASRRAALTKTAAAGAGTPVASSYSA
jgi:hypothetical protein